MMQVTKERLIAILISLYKLPSIAKADDYQNIYGNELQSCSKSNTGMALTGYTRTGSCVEYQDDSGSHHICIDLSSTNGGNFCDVTGQNDWCSSYMQCDTGNGYQNNDDEQDTCPIQYWCVCQWAFASYIEKSGGCAYIQDIKCDASNIEAMKAYAAMNSSSSRYENALECLESRCNVKFARYSSQKGRLIVLPVLIAFSVFTLVFVYHQRKKSSHVAIPNVKEPLRDFSG